MPLGIYNDDIHKDLKTASVDDKFQRFAKKHEQRVFINV